MDNIHHIEAFKSACASEWEFNKDFLERVGVNPEVLGKTVQTEHGVGRIVGLKARNRKMPFIVSCLGGKCRKMNLVAFKGVLHQNSLL
jgi:hypothetical protein